ncbi:hypothetical protein [uncultured Pseudonocardia sp.]|uniref:hypothetical protein n=1 Tax=uncultured Pseudonocardia sp. TaxID=211455 RepID=UPI002636D5E8|nr:hypothetical protein [uncultured Pseudonocardia sp.]
MALSEPAPTRLTELFDQESAEIQSALGAYAELAVVQARVQYALDAVARQARDEIAGQAAETARLALGVLDAVTVEQPRPVPRPEQARRSSGFGSLFSVFGPDEPEPLPPPPVRPIVNVDRALATVRDALETADRLRAAAVPPPPEIVGRPWAEDAALLGLLQDLLAAVRRQSPEYLTARVEQLADDLGFEHGIQVAEFDGTNRALFEVRPTTNPADTTHRTVRPALVRDGELLRAGEAREPAPPTTVPYEPTSEGAPR